MSMLQELPNNFTAQRLLQRARYLKQARFFFDSRGYIEIDTPLLSKAASIDEHIDLIEAQMQGERLFLITSPEYALKRLLSEGAPNCYQLGHVFRSGEISKKHSPEFTMAEWYRLDDPKLSAHENFRSLIQETLDFISLFTGKKDIKRLTYWGLFKHFCGLELGIDRSKDLVRVQKWLQNKDSQHPLSQNDSLEAYLSYILSYHLEPQMQKSVLYVIEAFPCEQAALATTYEENGKYLAHRFEVYLGSLELANGYHELTDPIEQRQRLLESQQARKAMGKDPLILDENFLGSLKKMPACSGVAVGFDRLMMIACASDDINNIQSIGWSQL